MALVSHPHEGLSKVENKLQQRYPKIDKKREELEQKLEDDVDKDHT